MCRLDCCKIRIITDTALENCVVQAQVDHEVPEVENIEIEIQNEEHEASEEESVVDNGNLVFAWTVEEIVL